MKIEHRIRWTPDGIVVQRYEDDRLQSEAKYGSIDAALGGLRVALEAQEEAYHFPIEKYPTADHIASEKLARALDQRLAEKETGADGT